MPSPLYLKRASMAKHQSANHPTVTIFTDGPPSHEPAIQAGLEASRARGIAIEDRKIACLKAAGECGVNGVLDSGEKAHMGFLVHKSITTRGADDLVHALGVETQQNAMGTLIKNNEPWGATNVNGVFVAGDAGTALPVVTMAMAHGNAFGPRPSSAFLD